MLNLFYFRTRVEQERHGRILICVAAFAYELKSQPIMTDEQFDKECLKIDTSIDTGHIKLDQWFKSYFQPHTGSWIHNHPELDKIERLYDAHYRSNAPVQ